MVDPLTDCLGTWFMSKNVGLEGHTFFLEPEVNAVV